METLVVDRRIQAGTDDVEEAASGAMYFGSSDLELSDDPTFNGVSQTVGLRFSGLGIPRGAVITAAYLQFQVDEPDSGAVSLEIRSVASDNVSAFASTNGDLSSRTTTDSVVQWSSGPWTTVGASGLEQRTPVLTELVQQIVERPGWAPDNALAFVITGSGERTAESFDGNPNAAPLLHIEYTVPEGPNTTPVASDDTAITRAGQAVAIPVLANDTDADGDPLSVTSVSAPANGQASINSDGTITYTPNAGFTGTDSFTYAISDPGGLSNTGTVNLTVTPATPAPTIVERRIANGADDVEEAASGSMYFDSSDLELVDDPSFNGAGQAVGLRFGGLGIPQGAIITNAYLQFQVDEVGAGAVSLEFRALASDNAAAFTANTGDLTSRATTSSFVPWSPGAWSAVGDSSAEQHTPDLKVLVQQIVDRTGWLPDNALAFIVTGTGERTAESFEGNRDAAPLLHVEYVLADGQNVAPIANDDTATTAASQAVAVQVLNNDGDPDGDSFVVSSLGPPGNGQASINADGTITYTPNPGFVGTDSFTYTLTDTGGLSDTATVTVTVTPAASTPVVIEQRISSGADDVEQAASGFMYFDSSDLELVDDPSFNGNGQTVGLRFASLDIPQGAVITSAYLQFQVDETDGASASLQIRAQAADSAGAFSTSSGDLTSRATTSSVTTWSPEAWTTLGATGVRQRSPDLAELVQEVVDRVGWTANNAMAFIVSGTGERTAESFDGDPNAAPLLHVEYVLPDPNNQAPTDITISDIQILTENQAGAVAATLNVLDPNGGDTHTFTLSDDRFEVVNNQLKLKPQARLDFEKGAQISLNVTAIDNGGLRVTESIAISVEDVSENRFVAIGDFGYGQNTRDVADLIDSLNVDFIVTVGDNAYDDVSLDDNVGQFFADYIGSYHGSYGTGSSVNRFFPTLGNHEYDDDSAGLNGGIDLYLDYFTLPGNERYYDFQVGSVHFFALNSNSAEPDGIDALSVQSAWLQDALAVSNAPHKIVFFHHPPFSSGGHGSEAALQWPFEAWDATAVLSGHDHTYERILRDDNGDGTILPYLVTGLGGRSISSFSGNTVEGSSAQFNDNYGALLVQASDTSITFEFVSIDNGGTVIDTYTLDLENPAGALAGTRLGVGLQQSTDRAFAFRQDIPTPAVELLATSGEHQPVEPSQAPDFQLTFSPVVGSLDGLSQSSQIVSDLDFL